MINMLIVQRKVNRHVRRLAKISKPQGWSHLTVMEASMLNLRDFSRRDIADMISEQALGTMPTKELELQA